MLDRIIDAVGRDTFNFYFEAGREMRANNRADSRGHYRHTTKTDLLGKENKKAKNRKKNKAARKARKKNR